MSNIKFFQNITPEAVQFVNASGTNTGKVGKSGDNLTITNAVGDVLFGDGLSDVYIGNGISSVDLLFEQSGAISAAAGSSITLTIGSADTTLALYAPTITNISTQASESTALMINGSNVVGTRELGTGAFGPTPVGTYLLNTTDTFTGSLTIIGDIRGSGQQLILNAGETYNYATGQGDEWVYANAEQGLQVNSSPDNWATGWAGRNTTFIGKADGSSIFPGALTWSGGGSVESNTAYDNSITGLAVTGTTTKTLTATQQDGGTLTASWTDNNDNTNWYVNAATFSTSTGVITGTGVGSAGFTVDIDGRYLPLAGGTMTGNIIMSNGNRLMWTADDPSGALTIHSNASNSFIQHTGTGYFQISNDCTGGIQTEMLLTKNTIPELNIKKVK